MNGGESGIRQGEQANPETAEWSSVDRAAERFLSPRQFASWQLGVAHNRQGGLRTDQELTRIYEIAKGKGAKLPGNERGQASGSTRPAKRAGRES